MIKCSKLFLKKVSNLYVNNGFWKLPDNKLNIYLFYLSQNMFRGTHFFHKENRELNWNIKFIDLGKSVIFLNVRSYIEGIGQGKGGGCCTFFHLSCLLVMYRFNCTYMHLKYKYNYAPLNSTVQCCVQIKLYISLQLLLHCTVCRCIFNYNFYLKSK